MNGKIRFLSAADRVNYGDLLFPLIFKNYLDTLHSDEFTFINYGIVKSDLSNFGAIKTKSFRQLENDLLENDKVVIGGGEVLFGSWTTLYAFINPLFKRALIYPFVKKIENQFKISKLILSKKGVRLPFSFSSNDFNLKNLRVYYSSVGGGGKLKIKGYEYLNEILSQASLISLRDKRSLNLLNNVENIKLKLVPDSALLMSHFYGIEELKKLKTIQKPKRNYFFVQVGRLKAPGNKEVFAEKLAKISEHFNVDIVLSPIGTAPGHEDDVVLKRLKNINPKFKYIEPNNVFDTMYLITNCTLYLGTSLHGAITAMSYCKPFVGLNLKIKKLESYSQTWVNEKYLNIDFNELQSEVIENYIELFKANYSKVKLLEQQKLIMENFEYILND